VKSLSNNKTELFISKAIKIHGSKYDYSLVDYKTAKIKVTIIYPQHGGNYYALFFKDLEGIKYEIVYEGRD
jgi:hypothetical protein